MATTTPARASRAAAEPRKLKRELGLGGGGMNGVAGTRIEPAEVAAAR
jgi:hypothetical protein